MNDIRYLLIRVPPARHRALKLLATLRNTSLQRLIDDEITRLLARERISEQSREREVKHEHATER